MVRELGKELPYKTTVEIEQFKEKEKITEINAVILVETKGQKAIIIGHKGTRLKSIGTKHGGAYLTGYCNEWYTVKVGCCYTGDQVGCTGA